MRKVIRAQSIQLHSPVYHRPKPFHLGICYFRDKSCGAIACPLCDTVSHRIENITLIARFELRSSFIHGLDPFRIQIFHHKCRVFFPPLLNIIRIQIARQDCRTNFLVGDLLFLTIPQAV